MNKHKLYILLLPGLVSLVAGLVVACNFLSDFEEVLENLPNEKSPEFKVVSLSVTPSAVMVGESAAVIATVTNVGDEIGIYTAVLSIEGEEVYSKDILVEPETSRHVSFQVDEAIAGSYKISIGKLSTIITVYDWSPYAIVYDSGVSMGSYYIAGELGHIVHFSPQTKPFIIKKIKIYGTMQIENPREMDARQFTIRIWDVDKSQQLWVQDFPWRLFNGPIEWREIEVPDIRVDGDFHVELVTHSGQFVQEGNEKLANFITICWDRPVFHTDQPASVPVTRSGLSKMGSLVKAPNLSYQGLNWFIRAEGEGAPLMLGYDDGEDESWHWTTGTYSLHFSPPSESFEVQKIMIYGYINHTGPGSIGNKTFTVRIREQATGEILWVQDFPWRLFDLEKAKWVLLKTPGIICTGDFYVRLIPNNDDENSCIMIGVDSSVPNRHSDILVETRVKPGQTGVVKGDDYNSEKANWMIRVDGLIK